MRRALRSGRVPRQVLLGGGSQTLARQLVASILLLSGTAAIGSGVSALAADPEPARPSAPTTVQVVDQQVVLDTLGAARAQAAADQQADQTQGRQLKHYDVRPPEGRHHDTLWDIAERTLGDPFRYKEVFELNKDRLQPDGTRLTESWEFLPKGIAGAVESLAARFNHKHAAPVSSPPQPQRDFEEADTSHLPAFLLRPVTLKA